MVRTILFDIDGTLIDSVDSHALAWQEILRRYGHDVPFQDVRRQIGKGADQLMPVFLSEEEVRERGEEIKKERTKLFKEVYLPDVEPFPGVRELIERLKRDGMKIVLASSGSEEEVESYERIANIGDLVEHKTSADDAKRSKPHPDIFEAALDRVGSPDRSEVLVVGDTPYDAVAAKKAGLETAGVLCGGFSEEDLKEAGCIALFRNPQDILARYDEFLALKR